MVSAASTEGQNIAPHEGATALKDRTVNGDERRHGGRKGENGRGKHGEWAGDQK